MTASSKKFCFTLNNFTDQEYKAIIAFAEEKCIFAVIGKEVGESETPHLQGFLNLFKKARLASIKKIMPRAHIELAKGSDEDNQKYCTKQDKNAYILGEPQFAGKRNDLARACELVAEKKTIKEIAQAIPEVYVKHSRGLQDLVEKFQPARDPDNPPVVLWLYGKAGVGKTRFAFDHIDKSQIYIKDGTQWWPNYTHQYCILVDDFDGHWPYRDFLRFLDRYPYQGQTKGGYVEINSPVIIITSELPPSSTWGGNELAQIIRRVNEIIHVE